MPTNTLNGRSFAVNEEGFFTNRDEWSEELAVDLAALLDMEMDEARWKAIHFMREDSAKTGATPTLHRMKAVGGFDVAELYRLFPGKPAKMMAWLSGLPKPVGCV